MTTISTVLTLGLLMMSIERLKPGRLFPSTKNWWVRAVGFNLIQAVSVFIAALTWDIWFEKIKLFQLSDSSLIAQTIIGYLVLTFIYYWWHRARHENPFLWKWFHQIHHSPARLEIITSFYKHPFEILINSILSSFILKVLLGLGNEATGIIILITGLAELFYHWNIKTPYWLGFLFQRPESHCVHHKKNYHRNNYSDLPIWDMIFGTFENPKYQPEDCGFDINKELNISSMLIGINVNKTGEKNGN